MSATEKITLNMSVVDLGKVDLLVNEGFYSNRTDFLRNAIRRLLDTHNTETEQAVNRHASVVGVYNCNRASLEKAITQGEKITLSVAGMLIIAKDVTPELAGEAIESIRLFGVLRADDDVKKVLAERMV